MNIHQQMAELHGHSKLCTLFRNCLAAALRHLARNKLYTAISVLGLAVGLCSALLAALVVHNRLSQDHFMRDYERVYVGVTSVY